MHRRTLCALALIGAGALVTPLLGTTTASASTEATSGSRTALPDSHPSWATASRAVGAPAADAVIHFRVQLTMRHSAEAERTALAVSTPGSSQYRHYLSSAQFNARYAPTAKTVEAVSRYLSSYGLSVGGSPVNRRWVTASGTAAQVGRAFGTSVRFYRHDGTTGRAASSALTVPAALAPAVLAVSGINKTGAVRLPMTRRPIKSGPRSAATTPSQCSQYWNQHQQQMPAAYGRTTFPTYLCGYRPGQLQHAYGTVNLIRHGQDGSGTKVAILDAYASPTIRQDANQLFSNYGAPKFAPGQFKQERFGHGQEQACGGAQGWWGEETLDVEAVHAMAPGADMLYVGAHNCDEGLDNAMNWVINNFDNPDSSAYGVSIVSNSYGWQGEQVDPSALAAEHAAAVQAAAEGLGLYFSSGDSGDESTLGNTPTPQPDYESSDPYVTAVGGTSLAAGEHGVYRFETGWGTDIDLATTNNAGKPNGYGLPIPGYFWGGAGGGTSHLFAEPGYQKGVVPAKLAKSYNGKADRVAPDVGMDADPFTGMLEGQTDPGTHTYTEYGIGGTSLAAPLFAGLQALTQGSGPRIGFANPTLYGLSASAYHDVSPPPVPIAVSNPNGTYLASFDDDSTLSTAPGYDNVTGRGSPKGRAFVAAERAALTQ